MKNMISTDGDHCRLSVSEQATVSISTRWRIEKRSTMERTEVVLGRQLVLVLVWILVAGSDTVDSDESDGPQFGNINSKMSTTREANLNQQLTNDINAVSKTTSIDRI